MKIFQLGNHPALCLTPANVLEVLTAFQTEQGLSLGGQYTLDMVTAKVFCVTIYNDALASAFEQFLRTRGPVPYEIVDHVPRPEELSQEAPVQPVPHQQTRFDPLVQEPVSMPAPMAMPAQADQDPTVANIHIKVRATLGDMVPLFHRIAAEHPDMDVYCNGINPGPDGVAWAMFSNPHVCAWFIQMARAQGIEVDDKFHPNVGGRQGSLLLVPPPALGGFSPYGTPQRQPEPQGAGGNGGGGGFSDRLKGWTSRVPRRR